jgi:hypothetical protein
MHECLDKVGDLDRDAEEGGVDEDYVGEEKELREMGLDKEDNPLECPTDDEDDFGLSMHNELCIDDVDQQISDFFKKANGNLFLKYRRSQVGDISL